MDNILEILIPLIFAAIYFFGNMFSGKSDGDGAPSIPGGRHDEDPDVIERQRKIQEEIRRKIAERRGGEDSRSPLDAPSSSPAPSQTQPPLATYESQIQERLKRIEATKRRAEKLKEQVHITQNNSTLEQNLPRSVRGSVRATLRYSSAARTAFIYSEILGQPISQKRNETIPGLVR
ncbi:MAG: hypothetical protein VXU42_05260 [Verrucomicrobiota bacterium]|nr:hypothetical protein [Verrucomicrobiota bacterium]